jgi:outer membrane protein OmpA-like peptidoglycan-associated protein/opacity protein-like surface antigen
MKGQGLEVGIAGGASIGQNEAKTQDTELNARALIGIPVFDFLGIDISGGMTRNSNKDYDTELIPVDLRLRLGWPNTRLTPYVYGGIGMVHRDVVTEPPALRPDYVSADDADAWSGYAPLGAGLQYRFSPAFAMELSGGTNLMFTDFVYPAAETEKENGDSFLSFLLGLRFAPGAEAPDYDHDGLSTKDEKALGSDPRNADTDGDGLDDGAEVSNYKTSPLMADTDNDGLDDYAEVNTHKTDPLAADSDQDKLTDGDEVTTRHTNPLKADTDADGLNDYAEVITYKTDPLKTDTDGEGLTDGDEVQKHHTDPLKADTDGGTVSDKVEVARNSDPLKASDDIPKKEVIQMETGKAIVLEGIVFKTGSADILPESEKILTLALNTMEENPTLKVEIQGFTDNVGSRSSNMKLSQKRADSVKAWLVAKNIDARRISTIGKGPDNPIADNSTPEGRQQNRRIQFVKMP